MGAKTQVEMTWNEVIDMWWMERKGDVEMGWCLNFERAY
jgi:hypothetical protein